MTEFYGEKNLLIKNLLTTQRKIDQSYTVVFQSTISQNPVYRKKFFLSTESDTKILQSRLYISPTK